ncbi:MAG TPA: 4-(cytidine 5'-diphospho)-2-C-methyl-D-erythritol kinase, partial [Thermoanaerobaculia bacterium]|nr:4-(cytidine 5'-diphospho)-2-C-methyl-D-erythritol kinase [Thermoanaerobaculia bacterium]
PSGEENLVLRAARALGSPPVRIELRKRIPAGGGLGGGSSDAAATLVALSRMFGLDLPLHDIALSLGSDVPFFLVGGTAYATGRGEILSPLPDVAPLPLLLLFPRERVSTPEAFRALERFSAPLGFERYRAMAGDGLLAHEQELINDFEEPVFRRLPHLGELKVRLYEAGAAWAGMSGSGSTIAGAFRSRAKRDEALTAFSDVQAVAAETIGRAAAVSI